MKCTLLVFASFADFLQLLSTVLARDLPPSCLVHVEAMVRSGGQNAELHITVSSNSADCQNVVAACVAYAACHRLEWHMIDINHGPSEHVESQSEPAALERDSRTTRLSLDDEERVESQLWQRVIFSGLTLEELGVPPELRQRLAAAGITNGRQLCQQTERSLRSRAGLDSTGLAEIRDTLGGYSLVLPAPQ